MTAVTVARTGLSHTYGVISVLFVGIVAAVGMLALYASWQVRATEEEITRSLPGDDLIPQPLGAVNHSITIHCHPEEVWPWLVQMGAGRAGWYAYDFIDNGSQPSSEAIIAKYQNISVGSVLPALPGATDAFVVMQFEQNRYLVLAWISNRKCQTSWAFVLEQPQPAETRLIVRGRIAHGYRPYGLPRWFAVLSGRPAHFVMQRKQLLGIAHRAEMLKQEPTLCSTPDTQEVNHV